MERVKEAFREIMQQLYQGQWTGLEEHRRLVRLFVGAWVEALEANGLDLQAAALRPAVLAIAADRWQPDATWNWW